MRRLVSDSLNHEKVQQLLAAVGSMPRQQSVDANVVDYNWKQPQYFTTEQRATLGQFAQKAAAAWVDEFSRIYHSDVEVSVVSAGQFFHDPSQTENPQAEYCFAFGSDAQKPFGLMRIPDASAAVWTGHLLGGDESSEDAGRSLSKLEESFLLDIASGLIKEFARAFGSPLQMDRSILRDSTSVVLRGSQEVFLFVLKVQKADSAGSAAQISLLICCDKLHTAAGKVAPQEAKTSTADNARAMRAHIQDIPVSLTVQLDKTMLRFKELAELQVNDIVILDKKITDPVEVMIDDRTVFQGHPAQSGKNHAVVIL